MSLHPPFDFSTALLSEADSLQEVAANIVAIAGVLKNIARALAGTPQELGVALRLLAKLNNAAAHDIDDVVAALRRCAEAVRS
jgi:hypothetical protein